MAKGRKALPRTYEARGFVKSTAFEDWIDSLALQPEAKARISKAIKFGLGIKELIIIKNKN